MTIDKAYDSWARSYDTVENKTRDLEEIAAKSTLSKYEFNNVIELGCGTGKNTGWLIERAKSIIAVDFSNQMLQRAKAKVNSNKIQFQIADITKPWKIKSNSADLITCSLILEHIQDLDFIFREAYDKLDNNGKFYICELHPFKQYNGSKAKFDSGAGITELEVFTHNVSDYVNSAQYQGFKILELKEWFDDEDTTSIPRLISFVFGN